MKFPKKCDLCEVEVKTAMEMKRHMKRHSYKEAKFKCDDCDFVGESDLAMKVYIGKHHSETYECGLCDVETKDLENLEIHLVSCEVYKCAGCSIKFNSIKDVKEHNIEKGYADGWHFVYHLKLERNNPSEVRKKKYCSNKI